MGSVRALPGFAAREGLPGGAPTNASAELSSGVRRSRPRPSPAPNHALRPPPTRPAGRVALPEPPARARPRRRRRPTPSRPRPPRAETGGRRGLLPGRPIRAGTQAPVFPRRTRPSSGPGLARASTGPVRRSAAKRGATGPAAPGRNGASSSAAGRSGASCTRRRLSPGVRRTGSSPATRRFPPRPRSSGTWTRASGQARPGAVRITSAAPTRSRGSQHVGAALRRGGPVAVGRCASRTRISGAGRGHTWRPGTSDGAPSSVAANRGRDFAPAAAGCLQCGGQRRSRRRRGSSGSWTMARRTAGSVRCGGCAGRPGRPSWCPRRLMLVGGIRWRSMAR